MNNSDEEFYSTLRSMIRALQDPLLTDIFPLSSDHNRAARILRHGLSVSAFALLENYIESKFSDLVASAAMSPIPYSGMTPEFQDFMTVGAVSGLVNRMRFLHKNDRQMYVERNLRLIASYNSEQTSYTTFGFSPRGSNVSAEDIKEAFSALGIDKAWQRLSEITQAVGVARVSLANDYRNLASSRHSSAHNPNGNVATADLRTHIETAVLVGLSVAALTRSAAAVFSKATVVQNLSNQLQTLRTSYRFVDERSNGTWVEKTSTGGKVVKVYPNETEAITGAVGRKDGRTVICRDLRQVPIGLH